MTYRGIDVENIRTWPTRFRKIMDSPFTKDTISNYFTEAELLNKRLETDDIEARFHENKYSVEYSSLIRELAKNIKEEEIVVYHCTRLLQHEIDEIRCTGLSLLSENLVKSKLHNALYYGYLTTEQYQILLTDINWDEIAVRRSSKLYFIIQRSYLKNENEDCLPFFQYWGGEAIRWYFNKPKKQQSIVQTIGTPCIIKLAISTDLVNHENLVKIMIQHKLPRRWISTMTYLPIHHIADAIPSSNIIDIISSNSPKFSKLYPKHII